MKIGIVGLGFVGLSLTSVLASKGYDIIGIDIDKEKCEKIRNGISPFFEPELEKLLRNGLKKKLKIVSDFLLIKNCDFIFVTVGTPQNTNGSINLSIIKKAISKIGENLEKNKKNPIILVKSTVIPGTMKKEILPILEKKPKNIKVNEIGNPTKIANNITPTRINPKIAGSINSAIIQTLLATGLFLQPSNF